MKTLPALLFTTALAVNAQIVAPTFDVVPDDAAPRTGFSMWLLSESFSCASRFSNLVVTVDSSTGGRLSSITLSYLETQDPNVRCAVTPGAVYGPKFQVPGLPADYYEVYANPKRECQITPPLCLGIPEVILNAGSLVVSPAGGGWFLKPKTVRANAAFDMQILDEQYGSCNYSFTNTVFLSSGSQRRIQTASLMNHFPGRLCLIDEYPNGPAFTVSGLAAGSYLVQYRDRDSCELNNPPCPVTTPYVFVDTLTVLAPLPIQPKGVSTFRPKFKAAIKGYRADGRKARIR